MIGFSMEMSVKGSVCMLACPALEDELIFGLENDPDEKNVYVVDVENSNTLIEKMEQHGIPYQLLDEYRMRTSTDLDPDAYNVVVLMNPMRLHSEPAKLKAYLEDQLKFYQCRFDVIGLYYGMCGNYGWDVSEWARENLSIPVTAFHDDRGEVCDDCIAVAVGGRRQYSDLVRNYTGMLFLTPSVATNWGKHDDPLDDREWRGFYDSCDDYMRDMFSWGGYKYALRVDTGLGDRVNVDQACRDVAEKMGLELIDPREPIATTVLAASMYNRTKAALGHRLSD